jgi:hypothetical protein
LTIELKGNKYGVISTRFFPEILVEQPRF